MKRQRGRVIRIYENGYGFIKDNDNTLKDNYFFHISGLEDTVFEDISIGMPVEYQSIRTDKGREAIKVKRLTMKVWKPIKIQRKWDLTWKNILE